MNSLIQQTAQTANAPRGGRTRSAWTFILIEGWLTLAIIVSGVAGEVEQIGESVVCFGEEPAALAWLPVRSQPVRVRNTYLPGDPTVYTIECSAGSGSEPRRARNHRSRTFRVNEGDILLLCRLWGMAR